MLPFLNVDGGRAIYIYSPNNAKYFNLFGWVPVKFKKAANIKKVELASVLLIDGFENWIRVIIGLGKQILLPMIEFSE